jgi:hypothetical protein
LCGSNDLHQAFQSHSSKKTSKHLGVHYWEPWERQLNRINEIGLSWIIHSSDCETYNSDFINETTLSWLIHPSDCEKYNRDCLIEVLLLWMISIHPSINQCPTGFKYGYT